MIMHSCTHCENHVNKITTQTSESRIYVYSANHCTFSGCLTQSMCIIRKQTIHVMFCSSINVQEQIWSKYNNNSRLKCAVILTRSPTPEAAQLSLQSSNIFATRHATVIFFVTIWAHFLSMSSSFKSVEYICTNFTADSSSRFPFRVWTQTQKSDANDQPIPYLRCCHCQIVTITTDVKTLL